MEDEEGEAQRLKTLAETRYKDSNLKSALKYAKRAQKLCPKLLGISAMVSSFKILRTAAAADSALPEWYGVLQAEPFSNLNTVKKQYKKLALLLHPDKNPNPGSEDAFKLVGEASRFLSDKIRKKEYDMKLRIRIQDDKMKESGGLAAEMETFWTACSTCRLLHQFEKRYLGHNLVCPSCRKSFKAVEVENNGEGANGVDENVRVRVRSERLRSRNLGGGRETSGSISILKMGRGVGLGRRVGRGEKGHERAKGRELKKKKGEMGGGVGSEREGDDGCEWSGGRLRSLRKRVSSAGEVLESSESKRSKANEEMMTLAEMQLEVKRKLKKEKENEERKKQQREKQKQERLVDFKRNKDYMVESRVVLKKSKDLGLERFGADEKSKDNGKNRTRPIDSDLEIMPVEDSDFYDFDKDRVEKSFKQGQVRLYMTMTTECLGIMV